MEVSSHCQEYADEMFIPYISGELRNVSRLDVVWDSYKVDSLKATVRAKRGKGVHRRVVASAPIHVNWQDFLRVDLNKTKFSASFQKHLYNLLRKITKNLLLLMGSRFHVHHLNMKQTCLPLATMKKQIVV